MVDAPAAPSRSISSALIASCSGAGRWRYNVATDTPIVGAISRADMPDARSFRAASIRLGVMTFLRPPTRPALRATMSAAVVRSRTDRKSVVQGKTVSGRVDHGGRRIIKEKTKYTARTRHQQNASIGKN